MTKIQDAIGRKRVREAKEKKRLEEENLKAHRVVLIVDDTTSEVL